MPIQNLNAATQASEIIGNSALSAVTAVKPATRSISTKAAPAELPPTTTKQPPSIVQLQRLVESMNKAIQQSNSSLEFSIDSNSKRVLVKLIDTSTGDVIRQIPSEEALTIAQSIDKMQEGVLLNKNA